MIEQSLTQLYSQQLKNYAEIRYMRNFKMKNKNNKTDHFLFFGTNNLTGLSKMKEAMWKTDPNGSFEFSDYSFDPDQTVLFKKVQPCHILKKMILARFKGKSVNTEVLNTFVIEETPFLESHYKRSILREMENKQELKVLAQNGRRAGTYPEGTVITFL